MTRNNIRMFHFGFSYVGFIYLLMLFILNYKTKVKVVRPESIRVTRKEMDIPLYKVR